VYIILALCTCLYAEGPASSPLTTPRTKALIQELQKAEANLENLIEEAEQKTPELKTYKARKAAISDWYWNERMKSWGEMAPALYGTDPSQKDYRQKMFERAKHFAFMLSLCEAARSSKNDWIFKSRFPTKETRIEFAKEHGLDAAKAAEPEQFLERVKAFYRSNSVRFEAQVLKWREQHSFITPAVWKQAEKDVMAESEMEALENAINELTPPEVRDAEKRVEEIRQELTRMAPHWEELRRLGRELQSSYDPGLDGEALSRLPDHAQETMPTVHGQLQSNESTTKSVHPELAAPDETQTNVSPEKQGISLPQGSELRVGLLWILLCIVAGLVVISLVGIYAWKHLVSRTSIRKTK